MEIKKLKISKNKIYFIHGDLSDNLLLDKNKIYIIDWEFARLSYGTEGLAYVFVHERISSSKKTVINHVFAEEFKILLKKHKETTKIFEKATMINDVIWAAKRYTEMRNKKIPGWKKYYDLTLDRMNFFDNYKF